MYVIYWALGKKKINDNKYPSLDSARKAAVQTIKTNGGGGPFASINVFKVGSSKSIGNVMSYNHGFIWNASESKEFMDEGGNIYDINEVRYINSNGTLGAYYVDPPKRTYKPSDFRYYVITFFGRNDEHICRTLNEAKDIASISAKRLESDIPIYKVLKWGRTRKSLSDGSSVGVIYPINKVKIGEMRYYNRNMIKWISSI